MGNINTVMQHYLEDRRRFADLFNGVFFQGREKIKPQMLRNEDGRYTAFAAEKRNLVEGKRTERIRDLKMWMESGGLLRILAVENQNLVDYAMPFRCMQYDTMEYGKQTEELKKRNRQSNMLETPAEKMCGMRKQDKLIPVYTLCLYHGEKEWDGPRSLKDMMQFGEEDEMECFFSDYPFHLFCINEETDFSAFSTELKEVFSAVHYRNNKKEFKRLLEMDESYRHLSRDTVEVLSALLNVPQMWEEREQYMNREAEEEEYDMCQAMREWLEDERNEGVQQGIQAGMQQGIMVIIKNMLRLGAPIRDICAYTGYSEEQIRQIQEEIDA